MTMTMTKQQQLTMMIRVQRETLEPVQEPPALQPQPRHRLVVAMMQMPIRMPVLLPLLLLLLLLLAARAHCRLAPVRQADCGSAHRRVGGRSESQRWAGA